MEENYDLCGIWETMKKKFTYEKFRSKSTQETRILLLKHLGFLEERLLDIDISSESFNNLANEERNGLYNLRDDPSIIKKSCWQGFWTDYFA